MSREAMQMALEALESDPISHAGLVSRKQAITALRQALETEQEPVAWMHNFITGNVITHIPADIGRHPERWTALYKDPTPCKTCESLAMAVMNDQTYHEKVIPKREWVGLTDQEIHEIDGYEEDRKMYRFARTIEAKLKEKNHG
jgi:hypothetical protein